MRGRRSSITLDAVREVGSPTILATATVIAALAPTAFAGHMIGQFLRPLPVGASVAMLFSLFVALTVTPFLALRLLVPKPGVKSHATDAKPRWLARYSKMLSFFLVRRSRAVGLALGCIGVLGAVSMLLITRIAIFKNMPISDVNGMAVIVDMPPGTTVVDTQRAVGEAARALAALDDVDAVQIYAGRPGPVDFQGLARGYGARTDPSQAEMQLQLWRGRSKTSHEVSLGSMNRYPSG